MKKRKTILLVVILFGMSLAAVAMALNVNQLPNEAQVFLSKYFQEEKVLRCERDLDDNCYEVLLSDGSELEFDAQGQWREIEIDYRLISSDFVKQLLPQNAYKYLLEQNLSNKVESIKRTRVGYKIDLRSNNIDEIHFDKNGQIISVEY